MIKTKEAIFSEKIMPLMQQIVEICHENDIALVASFGLDAIPPDHDDRIHASWILLGGRSAGSRRLNRAAGILLRARAENFDTEINLL